MYQLESTIFNKNDWQVETLPMPRAKADKLIKLRFALSEGRRRYRLIRISAS